MIQLSALIPIGSHLLDKVDKIDTEGGRIGIHRRPLEIKGGASGHSRILDRVTKLNGRGQGSAQGENGENAHYDV